MTKKDFVWSRIKAKAEQIEKADPLRRKSFAQCVDEVLQREPELYAHYRNS